MDLGVDAEFGTHSHIRGLSGGQKVKVVLAAAMWQSPHMLILDEPTNYLDRESLGALASAIQNFNGAVVMISHNSGAPLLLCMRPEGSMLCSLCVVGCKGQHICVVVGCGSQLWHRM